MSGPYANPTSRTTTLWRHADFLKLWAGQSVSLIGDQLTLLALPLTAISTLGATPVQVGALEAATWAPWLVVGLFAGVWTDRRRRRPIMIAADLGRAILLLSIPGAALLGWLRLDHLFLVAFLVGFLSVFFNVADPAFLPTLVGREHLVEGNSKLQASRSVAQIAGPGLAGWIVQIVGPPLAIVVDACSFLASASLLLLIRRSEPSVLVANKPQSVWSDLREGLRTLFGQPVLRAIAGSTATSNFCSGIFGALYLLYLARALGLAPTTIGLVLAAGGPSSLLGAVVGGRVARGMGIGRTVIAMALFIGVGVACVPLAAGNLLLPLLVSSQILVGFAGTVYNINVVSLRQAITPDRLQGRVNASHRFLVAGAIPFGSLVGGYLGQVVGLHEALVVAAVGFTIPAGWLLLSSVRSLGTLPMPVAEYATFSDIARHP